MLKVRRAKNPGAIHHTGLVRHGILLICALSFGSILHIYVALGKKRAQLSLGPYRQGMGPTLLWNQSYGFL